MAKKTFNLKEIIEMAVQIEVAGAAFYKSLKEKAQSKEASQLFGYLEEAEHQHITDFENVLESAL
jgi:rubrerythrin